MTEATEVLCNFIEAAWNTREPDACEKYLAPEYLHYMPGMAEPMAGPDGYRTLIHVFTGGFSDLRMTVKQAFGEGDQTCVVWTVTGTHDGEFNGMAPTGNKLKLHGVAVGTVAQGKLLRVISSFDNQELANQLAKPPVV